MGARLSSDDATLAETVAAAAVSIRRVAHQASADQNIEAAEDILDFLDRRAEVGGDTAAIVSAITALTHATLAVAHATQAGAGT